MSTRIGLIGDVHASPAALQQALDLFDRERVADIYCTGDIAGYFETLSPTIELLKKYQCKTVIGNHDQAWLENHPELEHSADYDFLSKLPHSLEFRVEGKSIYMVHAHPPDSQHGGIKLLDVNGELIAERLQEWRENLQEFPQDILIVGHSHQVFAEQLGNVLVVNPGSSQFNHSCMILELPELRVQTLALDGREIVKCWNFSMLFGGGNAYPAAKTPHD